VLLAYADESGDSGPIDKGGSYTYTVGCVVVRAVDWPTVFNELIEFRRRLKATHGIPVRTEIKTAYLIRGGGTLTSLKLAPAQRAVIYRAHLRMMATLPVRVFGVVVDKRSDVLPEPPDRLAWATVMERLERTSFHDADRPPFALIHDNGDNLLIRKVARKARRRITAGRAYGTRGQITLAAQLFIDDPIPRDSAQSYLIQLADIAAYAAFRTVIPPSARPGAIVPAESWYELGASIHTPVNRISGGTPGVVIRR
jgi:hypothetical protein